MLTTILCIIMIISVPGVFIFYDYVVIFSRRELKKLPFNESWKEYLNSNLKIYKYLPENIKEELHNNIKIFLSEKHFEGCGGLILTDEIKVTIAAEACILLLSKKKITYYPRLVTILVYPGAYKVKNLVNHVGTIEHSIRLGESHSSGVVILSWEHVKKASENFSNEGNVAYHEFAHQLDGENGFVDGVPALEHKTDYVTWINVFKKEYNNLSQKLEMNMRSVVSSYGLTNPAEFFAVVTESFFENPVELKNENPELYDVLKSYYKLDPAQWILSADKKY